MDDSEAFADGFIAGWQSVMGEGTSIPEIPSFPPIPSRITPYLHGISKGVDGALKQKAQIKNRLRLIQGLPRNPKAATINPPSFPTNRPVNLWTLRGPVTPTATRAIPNR
jgi:hypothetical protein